MLGRSDCYFFRKTFKGKWIQITPKSFPFLGRYAVLFKGILPSAGSTVLAHKFPFNITSKGLGSTDAVYRRGNSADLRFEAVERFSCEGRALRAARQMLTQAASEPYAQWLLSVIEAIRKSGEDLRESEIGRQILQMFDMEAIAHRRTQCEQAVGMLRPACSALLILIFLVSPCVVILCGFFRTWPVLLAAVFGNSLLIAFLFWEAHSRIYPSLTASRITLAVTLFLSPPAAIRAEDLIIRDGFCRWHPLAIAALLCDEATLKKMAAAIFRDTVFIKTTDPTFDFDSGDNWRATSLYHLEQFIGRLGMSRKKLLRAPVRQSPKCSRYCPRCLAQYTGGFKLCSDCGVELSAF